MSAQRPDSLSVPTASEPGLWTSQGDAEVRLRMGESGLAAEPPLTINQMFTKTVERFGDYTALSWKEGEQQKTMSYKEYYQTCRTAAKSFLKVKTREAELMYRATHTGCDLFIVVDTVIYKVNRSLAST